MDQLQTQDPEIDNLEPTEQELSSIILDTGKSVTESGARVEAELLEDTKHPEVSHKRKKMLTGHKLKILAELKRGVPTAVICKNHKISKTTLGLIASDPDLLEISSVTYVEQTKKLIAARFYQLADVALSHIDPLKLQRLDAYKLAMLAAISLDKARLVEGQPTENISFRSLAMSIHGSLSDLQARKAKILNMIAMKDIETAAQQQPEPTLPAD